MGSPHCLHLGVFLSPQVFRGPTFGVSWLSFVSCVALALGLLLSFGDRACRGLLPARRPVLRPQQFLATLSARQFAYTPGVHGLCGVSE